MYFPHCLGMGVDGLLIFTSRAVEAPLLSPSQNFVDVSVPIKNNVNFEAVGSGDGTVVLLRCQNTLKRDHQTLLR